MIRKLLPLLIPAALFCGCGKSEPAAGGNAATPTAAGAEKAPLEWAELKAFDAIAEKADGLAIKKEAAGLRVMLPSLTAALHRLNTSTVPTGVHNPLTVKELMADLGELETKLKGAGGFKDDELIALAAGVHAVVENLIHESGMPHTHDH
jgi:hypothetical protein